MRLVNKTELMKMPKGTMFRRITPAIWDGEWMLFQGPVGEEDFFCSDIGPQIKPPGYEDNDDFFLEFTDIWSRDGLLEDDHRYIVLDGADRAAMAAQILGRPFEPIRHSLGRFDYPTAQQSADPA